MSEEDKKIREVNRNIALFVLSMNHEKYISELILSLQKQTYTKFKIYWIDNLSKDNSFILAKKKLSESGLKYQIFRNKVSKSIPANINFLLETKDNESFVSLISADDYLHPENFQQKIQYLSENSKIPMVYSNGYYYYQDTMTEKIITEKLDLQGGNIHDKLLGKSFVFSIGTLIRAETFEVIGGFDEKVGIEDWDFYLRVSKEYEIGYIKTPLFYYRQHNSNMSLNVNLRYLEDCFRILKKYKKNNAHYIGVDGLMDIYLISLKKENISFFQSIFKIIKVSGRRKITVFYLKKYITN